ncbi:InlB B-repeat-containing protein [Roseburia sp.]|uniref:InlB B-repeat-containing protein n=1 Tax=Roseburia sp. TaxID=2049040 RepID=UPI00352002A3
MKKRVLAMFMAALVSVGTVLAPADMGSAYAAEVTQEETEKSAAEALLENETPGVTVETETSETEEIQTTEGKEIPETQMVEETSETEEAAETQTVEVIAETEETVDVQTTGENEARSATLSEMPTGLLPFEAVGEITLDRETAEEEEAENILKSSAYYNSTWEKYGSYYFYNQLSSKEKAYWDALNKVCLKYMTTQADAAKYNISGTTYYYIDIVGSSSLSLSQMEEVYQIFRYSNPQYYFLKSAYLKSGTYGIAGCVYPAFANGSARAAATKKVQSQVSSWQKKIDACSTDEKKVKMIHDLIIDKVEYNQTLYDNNFKDEDTAYSQSAYSVFCTDLTVCAGYSQAFEMMCNGSGIDAVAVTSYYHEWNKVRLNDSWYNVDCTWDDADGTIYYGYFERSDNYYDTVNYSSYVFHAEEDIWEGYLPACTIDSGATSTAPGTIATITQTVAKPVISASVSGTSYKVKITSKTSGAVIYYTTDGSEPNAAYSKGTRYTGAFTVSPGKTVKAVAVCNKYADSSVSSKKLAKLTTYKITFKSNGGKGSMSKQSMAKGVSTAISKNKFSKKYYTFAGWKTKANGKGKSYKNKQKIKLTKNITLYAQWKLTKYKITYKLNGGKNAKKNPTAYTYKTSTIKLKNPTRKGYVFKGWYLDKKFKKKVTVINKGSSGNKTLYAKWKKK